MLGQAEGQSYESRICMLDCSFWSLYAIASICRHALSAVLGDLKPGRASTLLDQRSSTTQKCVRRHQKPDSRHQPVTPPDQ